MADSARGDPLDHRASTRMVGGTRNDEITTAVVADPVRLDASDSSTRDRGSLMAYSGLSPARAHVALVVDDEQVIASIICQLLVRHGWHAIVVGDAEHALSWHEAREIGLLVTDIELPGITGLALVQLLRERDPDLPIIVVSGSADAAGRLETTRVAFVPKPIDFDEFMDPVRSLAG